MSRRNSDSSTKAPPDVYVGMMFVSIAALTTGIILLVLELNRYNWQLG